MVHGTVRCAVTAALAAALALPAAVPARTPISWDRHSLLDRGRPFVMNSGEVHPIRMPGGPRQWREVLETMRAAGLDTVSIYVFWSMHEPAPGRFRFTGRHDVERFLRIARDEGLRVLVRPGPYVQGELDAGGYPAWLLGRPSILRTREPAFTRAWRRWYRALVPRVARWQAGGRRGGTVVGFQVENEHPGGGSAKPPPAAARAYVRDLAATARRLGIHVPIFHNDPSSYAGPVSRVHFADDVDLYAFDAYPYGFACCRPWNTATFAVLDGIEARLRAAGVDRTPLFTAEVQGGLIPFGDDGSTRARRYRRMLGYETVQSISLLAQGLTMVNRYMTFGGTSWGYSPYPGEGTSYDYGAPIREWGGLGPRFDELRRIGLQIRAAGRTLPRTVSLARPPVAASDPAALLRVRRATAGRALHVFLRNADPGPGRAPRVTVDGRTTPPVPLPGGSARWLLARARIAGWRIDLTSAEMAHAGRRTLVLFGDRGGRYAAWLAGRRVAFTPRARPQVRRLPGGRRLVVVDRADAARTWVRPGGAVVIGPHLVTRRHVQTARATTATIVGPRAIRHRVLPGPGRVRLPALARWRVRRETPERRPGFDDRRWARLSRAATTNQVQPATGPVLAADDNGAPGTGFTWYRGRFRGTAAGVCLEGRHRYHVWLNGRSLGTVTSDAEVRDGAVGGLGVTPPVAQPAHLAFPTGATRAGENVLAVLVESWGHAMDAAAFNQAKQPRGLISASLDGRGPGCGWTLGGETAEPLGAGGFSTAPPVPGRDGGIDWRIRGGRPAGYPNVSGLHGERAGWHRAALDDRRWARTRLPARLPGGRGEVTWYRTAFRLRVPAGTRAAVALRVPPSSWPAEVYLNGLHVARAGRDRERDFVLPRHLLRERGANVLALARWDAGATRRMDRPRLVLQDRRRVLPLHALRP